MKTPTTRRELREFWSWFARCLEGRGLVSEEAWDLAEKLAEPSATDPMGAWSEGPVDEAPEGWDDRTRAAAEASMVEPGWLSLLAERVKYARIGTLRDAYRDKIVKHVRAMEALEKPGYVRPGDDVLEQGRYEAREPEPSAEDLAREFGAYLYEHAGKAYDKPVEWELSSEGLYRFKCAGWARSISINRLSSEHERRICAGWLRAWLQDTAVAVLEEHRPPTPGTERGRYLYTDLAGTRWYAVRPAPSAGETQTLTKPKHMFKFLSAVPAYVSVAILATFAWTTFAPVFGPVFSGVLHGRDPATRSTSLDPVPTAQERLFLAVAATDPDHAASIAAAVDEAGAELVASLVAQGLEPGKALELVQSYRGAQALRGR